MDELTREFLIESRKPGPDGTLPDRTRREAAGRRPDGEIFRSVHTIKGTTGFLASNALRSLPMPAKPVGLAPRRQSHGRSGDHHRASPIDGLPARNSAYDEAEGAEGDGEDCALIDTLESCRPATVPLCMRPTKPSKPPWALLKRRRCAGSAKTAARGATRAVRLRLPRSRRTPVHDRVPDSPHVDAPVENRPMLPNRVAPQPTPPRKARCAST